VAAKPRYISVSLPDEVASATFVLEIRVRRLPDTIVTIQPEVLTDEKSSTNLTTARGGDPRQLHLHGFI